MQIQYLGRFLDTREDENITYTIQAQDLADISTVNSSVTTSFKLPKTSSNYEALKYLSLPSDTSVLPYIKNEVKLYDHGTIIINNGWLKLNSTDDNNFNVNIEDGIIDFFKAIENKTIGRDLDLSDVNHSKDLLTVLDSFERFDYTYIVADYNGLNTYIKNGVEHINTDYLVPSLNNKYIWDKIFEFAGFTYSGTMFNSNEFVNLWLTYPKAPPTDISDEDYPTPVLRFQSSSNNPRISYNGDVTGIISLQLENVFTDGITYADGKLTVITSGTYEFKSVGFNPTTHYADYRVVDGDGREVGDYRHKEKLYFGYYLNGQEYRPDTQTYNSFTLSLREGDELTFFLYWDILILGSRVDTRDGEYYIVEFGSIVFPNYDYRLLQKSQTIIDFGSQLLDFSMIDYIKEILIRFSLTPFIDVENRHIEFLTLDQRLSGSDVVDWTDKYIERTNEVYTYKSYAIKNWFRHKYNDPNANFNDGFVSVNNVNLDLEKDIWKSKIYSYNNEITTFYSNDFQNNSFPIWDREIKEIIDNDTNQKTYEVKYKGLENRFYFIRRRYLQKQTYIGSQLLRAQEIMNRVTRVDTTDLSYNEMVLKYYSNFSRIMSDTRIHDITLDLNINDLLDLDLKKLYYFSQENQYYILNRIVADLKNKSFKGEFLRVKYR